MLLGPGICVADYNEAYKKLKAFFFFWKKGSLKFLMAAWQVNFTCLVGGGATESLVQYVQSDSRFVQCIVLHVKRKMIMPLCVEAKLDQIFLCCLTDKNILKEHQKQKMLKNIVVENDKSLDPC